MIDKLCGFILYTVMGWTKEGDFPKEIPKFLIIGIPHTSNWDFVIAWLAFRTLHVKTTIFVKDTYFVWPLRPFCRFFGVAPVNRRESTNFVDAITRQFEENETLYAAITPEGTRNKVDKLKSGYYYIAKKANIPIIAVGPDYGKKIFYLSSPRDAMDSFEEDQEELIKFTANMVAKTPQNSFE